MLCIFSHCLNLLLDDFSQQIVILRFFYICQSFELILTFVLQKACNIFHTSASEEMNVHWHTHILKRSVRFKDLYLHAVVFAELCLRGENSGKLHCILTFEADPLNE